MPNVLDGLGLETATREELVTYFTAKYREIYGADINLSSDTPDGQMMNIFIQSILDTQDLLVQIYNSFDPDNAIGLVLDQRVTINGIQRQEGTDTITPITVVVSQSVNLYGLDQEDQDTFTVADNAGNRWVLETTVLGVPAGTHVYNFRSRIPGAQLTVPNTINVPVTIVLGVESVNNPTTYSTLGINEESDAQLRLRRQKSVSLSSQGYLAGLIAALENITGMTSAFVYENTSDSTDVDGVPGHSIWVIVAGTAADADIAQAIYTKRNAGCGMKGDVEYTVTQVDGSPFILQWDTVQIRNLFIKFTASSINGTVLPDVAAIRDGLPLLFVPGVNQDVNVNQIATYVQQIDSNALVTSAGLSLGYDQTLTLSGVAASGAFKISYNGDESASIAWNDAIGTIQSKVQAVDGLGSALVTGSIASQSLVFDLSAVGSVQALLFATANTLLTGGAAAITFAYDAAYTNTLSPPSKQNQLIIAPENIQIVPIIITPSSTIVATAVTVEYVSAGGYGDYHYTLAVNNSGATIDPDTGLYTAGATPNVSDTVRVTDDLGNTVTASVSVVP